MAERLSLPGPVPAEAVEVAVRRNRRARRITLRVDQRGVACVTAPEGVTLRHIATFVEDHRDWLNARLAARAATVALIPGATIPVLGQPHAVRAAGGRGRPAHLGDGEILVRGAPEHHERRIIDLLRREARRTLTARCDSHAAALGLEHAGIRIRDTRSRWGSCSARRVLSFSWRLILAPEPVMDYVAAHEVAHLAEMNHGPRFWALVERRVPDWRDHRAWLHANGPRLHRYGARPMARAG